MNDWTAGYVADIGYTFGYYNELNPLRTRLALLNSGFAYPEFSSGCELGFGQGVSANFHAASSSVAWYGTDFNPEQAGFAQEMARASGSGALLFDDAFDELARRKDIPDFDFIGLHGIWSWISDENRQVIVDFIRQKLKVGGVVYMSYNTYPGWATFAPMRHLMTEHADIIGAEGRGIVSRIDDAMSFAEKLLSLKPHFLTANPFVADKLSKLKGQNRHYLAHEYFNRDWHPMHFATMADWLKPAKLQYTCSANYFDHVDILNLTTEQQEFLKAIPDPMFRESVKDFIVNQQFRRDYWVRGARRLTLPEQVDLLRKQELLLVSHRPDVSLKVNTLIGEANMSDAIYPPILDIMADHKVRSIGQIEQSLQGKGISFQQLVQAIILLSGIGHLIPVQDEATAAKAKKRTDKLNLYLMNRARYSTDSNYLVSPVSGGGFAVDRFIQLCILARQQGLKQPAEWAKYVWDVLSSQNQKIRKEEKTLETAEENLAELQKIAESYSNKLAPIFKALQIN